MCANTGYNSSKRVIFNVVCFLPYVLLGALAKFRKANISFVMSVCVSLCSSAWKNSCPTGWIFVKFGFEYFSKNLQENTSFY
jgi:hypothetical protein